MSSASENRIPVTIVTGFLGSGKTTLVNRVLHEAHGSRIAVIENELGEEGIDGEILLQDAGDRIVEMMNGCICCTVRGDLVRILGDLAAKRAAGELAFERVVIETTGLADPAPVAQTFFLEPGVVREYRLDGIVTLVDAKHGGVALTEHREAQAQVGFADRLLLTKTDLVHEDESLALIARLERINAKAKVAKVAHGRAAIADLLDIGGFELDHAADIEHVHTHTHTHTRHSDEIASFVYRESRPFDLEKLENFLALLVDRYGADLLRYKGILSVAGRDERIVFQGVHGLLGAEPGRPWPQGGTRGSTLVFIGRKLPRALFEHGLSLCVQGSAADPATVLRAA
jgi:G3E family GTPase